MGALRTRRHVTRRSLNIIAYSFSIGVLGMVSSSAGESACCCVYCCCCCCCCVCCRISVSLGADAGLEGVAGNCAAVGRTAVAATGVDDTGWTELEADVKASASEARTTSHSSGSRLRVSVTKREQGGGESTLRASTHCISHHFMTKTGTSPTTLVTPKVNQNVG